MVEMIHRLPLALLAEKLQGSAPQQTPRPRMVRTLSWIARGFPIVVRNQPDFKPISDTIPERQTGDKYPPNSLPDHRGPLFRT
ncbi:hypothetical protein B0H19DRAFT_1200584 [Mycena capillaripes]|nr:hypothetical protein B0H19DRAFT_1200584 [Mycena capillaripes]